MALILNPAQFNCPKHGLDLTDDVKAQLEEQDIPVAGYDVFYYEVGKPKVKHKPFIVIVKCPGKTTEQAHEVECSGEYSST